MHPGHIVYRSTPNWQRISGILLAVSIVEGLIKIGQRLGVEYRLSTPISSVLFSVNDRTVNGVVLSPEEILTASVVVCNADLVYAYNNLLPPSTSAKSLSRRPASCSSISFY